MADLEYVDRPNVLVIGAGSIGRRHAGNLKALGAAVSIYDLDRSLAKRVSEESGLTFVSDLDEALNLRRFSAAAICTPNHLHIQQALPIAAQGIDLFIEKPLSHTMVKVEELMDLARDHKLVCMCGYNLRFEPGLRLLKQLVDPGKVAFSQIEFGSYLPGWRPGTNYRGGYSATRGMGGGIILDAIHEVDYACWLFGYPSDVLATRGRFSDLEIDVEDTVDYHFRYPDKIVTIHSDYIQKDYVRRCKVGLKNGDVIEWEFGRRVRYPQGGEIKEFDYSATFDKNQMYIDEMKHFLECIRARKQPESDLTNAVRTLGIALSAKG